MDHRREVREFLTSRRGKISPQQAGLPSWGGARRRVPGLRREEVALLAGVSVDYYTRLERGSLDGVSDPVLDAIANALQLDEAERAHLDNLARAAQTGPRRPRTTARAATVRPELQRILDAITEAPAYLRNGRRDLVAALRVEAGKSPSDQALFALVGELCTRSDESPPSGPARTSASTAAASRTSTTPWSARCS